MYLLDEIVIVETILLLKNVKNFDTKTRQQ